MCYSLGRRHFSDEQSRPGSSSSGSNTVTSLGKLAPLEHRPSVPELQETRGDVNINGPMVPMPPSKTRPPSVRRHVSGGRLRTGINEIVEEPSSLDLRSSSASATGRSSQRVGSVERFVMPKPPVETLSPKAVRSEKHQQAVKLRENDNPRVDGRVGDHRKERRVSQEDHSINTLYEECVRPLLEGLNVAAESKDLCWTISQIYTVLEEGNLLGRRSGKRRGTILKAVFKLLDNDDPQLLLRLARLILAVSLTVNVGFDYKVGYQLLCCSYRFQGQT